MRDLRVLSKGAIFLVLILLFVGARTFGLPTHTSPHNGDNGNNGKGNSSSDGYHSANLTDADEEKISKDDVHPSPTEKFRPSYKNSMVNEYLIKTLKAEDAAPFNLSLRDEHLVAYADRFFDPADSANQDAYIIQEIAQNFMRNDYGNLSITAKAGRGKTHLIPMLNMVFSYGAMPDHVKKILQLDNPILKKFYDQYLGNTQLIYVNSTVLGKDNTPRGQAYIKADERMKQVLAGLYEAAEKDAQSERHLKTFFIFDEVALLTQDTLQSMKVPLDKSGFKDPNDEFATKLDSGTHTIALTTPSERAEMIRGDTALERRLPAIRWRDMNENQAFDILQKFSIELKTKWGLDVDDDALGYLIQMNDFMYSPPMAMPASIKMALDQLEIWFAFNRSENGKNTRVTLLDAQRWVIKQAGLSERWLPGPNGEPPLYNMAAEVKKDYTGFPQIVDQICASLEVWARLGFGGPFPEFYIGGITGSGKNTLFRAIFNYLYGSDGQHYSIGAASGKAFEEIFEGIRPSGNSVGKPPLLVQNSENGNGPSGVIFDEAADAPSKFFNNLKVYSETGILRPVAQDNNVRYWIHPVAFLGEYGREVYEGLTDEEIAEKAKTLPQKITDKAFTDPKYSLPGQGKVSEASLQRAKIYGGVFIIPPTAKSNYPNVVELNARKIILGLKKKNNLDLTLSDKLKAEVVKRTLLSGEDSRGLVSRLRKLSLGAVSAASAHSVGDSTVDRVSLHNAKLNLTVDENGVVISVEGGSKAPVHVSFKQLYDSLDVCASEMESLKDNIKTK